MAIDQQLKQQLLIYQKNEITEHRLYTRLASLHKNPDNKDILKRIADDEHKHYGIWKKYTQVDVAPSEWRVWMYYFLCRLFGLTFGTKLMERNEKDAQENYSELKDVVLEIDEIIQDENSHEEHLVGMLSQERLNYTGSIVLGLNDALVELLGALAGLTLALQSTQLIALSALTTGIAAAMSMAASEYLSSKAEDTDKNPLKASAYTGITYFITVIVLVFPYLIIDNYYICFALSLFMAMIATGIFNFYLAVTQEVSFRKRFAEMASLSLGIATLSFGVGYVIRKLLGIEV